MSSVHIEPQNLPDEAPHNHGRTTAAWVANIGITIGAIIAAFGIAIPNHAFTWAGVGVIVISFAAGAALRALGHGQALG